MIEIWQSIPLAVKNFGAVMTTITVAIGLIERAWKVGHLPTLNVGNVEAIRSISHLVNNTDKLNTREKVLIVRTYYQMRSRDSFTLTRYNEGTFSSFILPIIFLIMIVSMFGTGLIISLTTSQWEYLILIPLCYIPAFLLSLFRDQEYNKELEFARENSHSIGVKRDEISKNNSPLDSFLLSFFRCPYRILETENEKCRKKKKIKELKMKEKKDNDLIEFDQIVDEILNMPNFSSRT